jgi:hypothetical protein
MRTLGFFLTLGLGLLLPLTASAQEPVTTQATYDTATPTEFETADGDKPGPLVLGAEIGVIFPQPFTELGSHVAFGIELGYKLPFIEEKLEIFTALAFSPPPNNFTDTRPEGNYDAELDQQELFWSLGPRFRFLDVSSDFNISLALGPRLYFLRTYSNGSRDGKAFAEFNEQSTEIGFFATLGGEFRLGPGALFLDLEIATSDLDHTITGDANTGSILASLGYRFFLL